MKKEIKVENRTYNVTLDETHIAYDDDNNVYDVWRSENPVSYEFFFDNFFVVLDDDDNPIGDVRWTDLPLITKDFKIVEVSALLRYEKIASSFHSKKPSN